MTRFLLRSLTAAIIAGASASSVMALPTFSNRNTDPLSRMKKVERKGHWSGLSTPNRMKKVAPNHTASSCDDFQYIYGPDGSIWYASTEYDTQIKVLEGGYATEDLIKGFSFTIYDSEFNEIGTIRDQVMFEGTEYRCAQVMLDIQVTQKFFNYNDGYEVMVALCMNDQDYTVNIRTNVYTIGGAKDENGYDKSILTLPGYPVDAINCSPDKWGEQFYVTFLESIEPNVDDYADYLDYLYAMYNRLTTYKKAGSDNQPKVFHTEEIKNVCLPGDMMNTPMMLSKNINGTPTFIYSQYEKSFFIDPSGWSGNEDMTPDNNLLIDVYQLVSKYDSEPTLVTRTLIPAVQNTTDSSVLYTFYGIGTLMYQDDVDYGHYTDDGRPAFVVSIDEYRTTSDDSYNSSYFVYDADGNQMKALAMNTENFMMLSDVPGCEPQAVFIHTLDDFSFEFVDLYSGDTVLLMDQTYEGDALSATMDRVATADGYQYAIAYGYAMDGGDDNVISPVGWFDRDGNLVRLDKINVGKGVEMAQIYMDALALSPYIFNTDDRLEYMVLVKRAIDGTENKREEFLIIAPDSEPLETMLPDEEKGNLNSIMLFPGDNMKLLVLYLKNHKFTADSYDLPFTYFAGGDGTENNPYQIATAGDLMQVGKNTNANYVMVNDIDCGGHTISPIHDFRGKFDGQNYSINNLAFYDKASALFESASEATLSNIIINNAEMHLTGNMDAATLVATAINSKIENVHVRNLAVDGKSFEGAFGAIACRLWRGSEVIGCGVSGAEINLPGAPTVGGIVGEMRTGSSIKTCAFSGDITANNTLGGIVGSTTTGDESISNCHANANLRAKNVVGGIAGFNKRSIISRCYAEGTVEATEPSQYRHRTIGAGGIVGELQGDWEGTANVPVTRNYVGVSSIKYPAFTEAETWPHQHATVHRVVGRTSYNEEPEQKGEDADGNPIYKDKVIYEEGIINNIVADILPTIDADFAERSMEGTTVSLGDINAEMLQELGLEYGDTVESPWKEGALAHSPLLYFEDADQGTSVGRIEFETKIIRYDGETIFAEGHSLALFTMEGQRILSGENAIRVNGIPAGVYAVTAKNVNGHRSSMKIIVK